MTAERQSTVDDVIEEARRTIRALGRAMELAEFHPTMACIYGCIDPVSCVFPHDGCPHCIRIRGRAREVQP